MGLEVSSNIAGLVTTNPAMTDPVYDGPRHFWLIKSVLKNIFPGAGGQGFAIPIVSTEVELNYLQGATSNIQDQLDATNAKTLNILLRDGTTIVEVSLA